MYLDISQERCTWAQRCILDIMTVHKEVSRYATSWHLACPSSAIPAQAIKINMFGSNALIFEGDCVIARSSYGGGWWPAKVLWHDTVSRLIHVRWDGWEGRKDWLPEDAILEVCYKTGESVYVLDEHNWWWKASVRQVDAHAKLVLVHHSRDWAEWDEWVPYCSVCPLPDREGSQKRKRQKTISFLPYEQVIIADTGFGVLWGATVRWHDAKRKLVHLEWQPYSHGKCLQQRRDVVSESNVVRPLLSRLPSLLTVQPSGLDAFAVTADSDSSRASGWVRHAMRLFRQHGFVILRRVLGRHECESLHAACHRVEAEVRKLSPTGNRGDKRWSFSLASKTSSMLHEPAWAYLLRCTPLIELVELLFPGGGMCTTAGGDFVAAGAERYQRIHGDVLVAEPFDVAFPPPYISANFVVHPVSATNGPLRIIPGTQRVAMHAAHEQLALPAVSEEPDEWLNSTLHPLEPGDAIIRDVRVLHGGTPNMSGSTRFLPSLEFASWPYQQSKQYKWDMPQSLPADLFVQLPWQAQTWCYGITAPRCDIKARWLQAEPQ